MAEPLQLPTEEEVKRARELFRELDPARGSSMVHIEADAPEHPVKALLPREVFEKLLFILEQMASGRAVMFMPIGAELTTQQAADLLNVSRPFLIKLIGQGKLRCHKVGSHRRIRAQDLLDYKREQDRRSREAVDELTRIAQEELLDYQ